MAEQEKSPDRTALVLGATGGAGGEITRQLLTAGWRVRTLHRRHAGTPEQSGHITWLTGDAMQARDVAQAARGCGVIVHAVNPPGYRHWQTLVLPMLAHTIAAAVVQRATIVLPGNFYNYGPDAFPVMAEDAPQHPATRKGAIRVRMEQMLERATQQGARALIVRAGDFFGPGVVSSWFSQVMVRPGQPIRAIWSPGQAGIAHQWAYLPDFAQTVVQLLARREHLDAFARFHMAGHWDADGAQMTETISRIARQHGMAPRVRAFPWRLAGLAAPLLPTLREALAMRHLWRQALRLQNTRLLGVLGEEPHTPWDEAVRATLAGLGCLASSVRY